MLAHIAAEHHRWEDFVRHANRVMFERHLSCLKSSSGQKIGDHHLKAGVQDPRSPLISRDLKRLRDRDHEVAVDLQLLLKWLDVDPSIFETVDPQRFVEHFAIQKDKYGMLIRRQKDEQLLSRMKRARSPECHSSSINLRAHRRRFDATIDTRCATQHTAREGLPEKQIVANIGTRRATKRMTREGLSQRKEDDHEGEGVRAGSSGTRELNEADNNHGMVAEEDTRATPCECAGSRCFLPADAHPYLKQSYQHALDRHEQFRPNGQCDANLSWIARMRLAKEHVASGSELGKCDDADVIVMDPGYVADFTRGHRSALQVPILIRKEESTQHELSLMEYLEKLSISLAETLEVKVPNRSNTECREDWNSDQVLQFAENPGLGINVLEIADVTPTIPGPSFLSQRRFELLQSIAGRLKSLKKGSDITGCIRFNLLGGKGAFSGAHCDALSGTWIRNIVGIKLWMWIHPKDMSDADWQDFARHGHRWIPPPDKVCARWLEPGEIFVMPAGLCIVHAVQTVQPCAMVGGMFWDEACVRENLECLARLMKSQNITNEPVPLEIGDMMDQLLAVTARLPSLNMNEIAAAVEAVRALRCDCKSECKSDCPCASVLRRCTKLCRGHRSRKCIEDLWWENE
jgi:hypothetical protein